MKRKFFLIMFIMLLFTQDIYAGIEYVDFTYPYDENKVITDYKIGSLTPLQMRGLVHECMQNVSGFNDLNYTMWINNGVSSDNELYCGAVYYAFEKGTVSILKPYKGYAGASGIYSSKAMYTYYLNSNGELQLSDNQYMKVSYSGRLSSGSLTIHAPVSNQYAEYFEDDALSINGYIQSCTQPIAPDEESALLYLKTGDPCYLTNGADFMDIPVPFNLKAYYKEDGKSIYFSYNNVDYAAAVEPSTFALLSYYSADGGVILSDGYSLDYALEGAFDISLEPLQDYPDGYFTIYMYNLNKINGITFEGDPIVLRYVPGTDVYYINDNEYSIQPYEEPTNVDDSILSALINLPKNIWNFISQGFSDVVNAIKSIPELVVDGLKNLFVPSEEDFANIYNDWNNLLADRFGAVYQAFDYVITFAKGFTTQSAVSTVLMPTVTVPLAGSEFSFGGYDVQLVPDGLDLIVAILKKLISLICTLMVLNTLKRKFSKRLLGGSDV